MPILTILLPTYNGAAFFEPQLRSILDQSVADFRLLAVDDGSSDATPELLAHAAATDRRIQILSGGGGNQGQRHRLRQLAAASDTDLIAIADQDDFWDQDKLAHLLASRGEATLCFGSSHLIDATGESLGRELIDSLPPPYRAGDRLSYLFRPLVSAHALIARRDLLNAKSLGRALPFDWLMSLEAAFGAGLVYQPAARTFHRLHGANQSNGIFAHPFGGERLISRYAFLSVVRDWMAGRVRLLGMLEHLSYADSVPAAVRRDVAAVRAVCAAAWLDGVPPAVPLEQTFRERLRPLAGSAPDWAFAEVNLQSLSAPPLSPARLRTRARRLALLADRVSASPASETSSAGAAPLEAVSGSPGSS